MSEHIGTVGSPFNVDNRLYVLLELCADDDIAQQLKTVIEQATQDTELHVKSEAWIETHLFEFGGDNNRRIEIDQRKFDKGFIFSVGTGTPISQMLPEQLNEFMQNGVAGFLPLIDNKISEVILGRPTIYDPNERKEDIIPNDGETDLEPLNNVDKMRYIRDRCDSDNVAYQIHRFLTEACGEDWSDNPQTQLVLLKMTDYGDTSAPRKFICVNNQRYLSAYALTAYVGAPIAQLTEEERIGVVNTPGNSCLLPTIDKRIAGIVIGAPVVEHLVDDEPKPAKRKWPELYPLIRISVESNHVYCGKTTAAMTILDALIRAGLEDVTILTEGPLQEDSKLYLQRYLGERGAKLRSVPIVIEDHPWQSPEGNAFYTYQFRADKEEVIMSVHTDDQKPHQSPYVPGVEDIYEIDGKIVQIPEVPGPLVGLNFEEVMLVLQARMNTAQHREMLKAIVGGYNSPQSDVRTTLESYYIDELEISGTRFQAGFVLAFRSESDVVVGTVLLPILENRIVDVLGGPFDFDDNPKNAIRHPLA